MLKRITLVFAMALTLVTALAAIPPHGTQPPVTVFDDHLDAEAICQQCDSNADAMRVQCEAVYGEGDADCRSQSDDYRNSCKTQYCIMTARAIKKPRMDDAIFPTIADLAVPTCIAGVDCDSCSDAMMVAQTTAEEALGWCAGQSAGLAYCQAMCPTCGFCRIKLINYSIYCL